MNRTLQEGSTLRRIIRLAVFAVLFFASFYASAQTVTSNQGFQINRYEPTAAGEWSFWVDHPWYSSTRYFAGGITLNYGHNPLVFGFKDLDGNFAYQDAVIAHQLIGHLDLAGSFLDRVLVAASLPITLLERGKDGSNGISLVNSGAVGDLRLGARVRLFGQPYGSAISMSLGADLWIPINSLIHPSPFPVQVGESGVRVLPKVMLGGLSRSILWSFSVGFLYRPDASIGTLPPDSGNTVGSELQFGAAVAYANKDLRFSVGPEALLSTVVTGGHGLRQDYTSLELLLGLHYNIAKLFQLGVGGGLGLLHEPGTPDGRVLLRFAYAPMRGEKPKDRDHDGISDGEDACPDQPGERTLNAKTNGCPPPDSDGDGIIDAQDQCPSEAMGQHPDREKNGCPLRDRDGDGVFDNEDQCPDEAMGQRPDPEKKGCPLRDRDGDGVFDAQDQCIDLAAGANADPNRPGCPDKDSDGDGVFDGSDQCKDVPAGMFPDPNKKGCPLSDRDHDFVPDTVDACPDQSGAPSVDPQKNGCPGLVKMTEGQIVILRQVFFATNKDAILKKSYPVLDAVVAVLKATPGLKKIAIEGHTDNKGKPELNRDLSDRRAKSVLKYLVEHGVEPGRLEAKGYGPDRPIADNKKAKGRALNRRTDFHIVDPPPADTSGVIKVIDTPQAEPVGKEGKTEKPAPAAPDGKADQAPADTKPNKKGKKGKKGKGALEPTASGSAEGAAAQASPLAKGEKPSKKGKKSKKPAKQDN